MTREGKILAEGKLAGLEIKELQEDLDAISTALAGLGSSPAHGTAFCAECIDNRLAQMREAWMFSTPSDEGSGLS